MGGRTAAACWLPWSFPPAFPGQAPVGQRPHPGLATRLQVGQFLRGEVLSGTTASGIEFRPPRLEPLGERVNAQKLREPCQFGFGTIEDVFEGERALLRLGNIRKV